jgi:hypothetical protein
MLPVTYLLSSTMLISLNSQLVATKVQPIIPTKALTNLAISNLPATRFPSLFSTHTSRVNRRCHSPWHMVVIIVVVVIVVIIIVIIVVFF